MLTMTLIRAPTSFLTSTNAGVTLNRFSQDLELIDNDLPTSLDQTIFQLLSLCLAKSSLPHGGCQKKLMELPGRPRNYKQVKHTVGKGTANDRY
jgi:hypothetical protein